MKSIENIDNISHEVIQSIGLTESIKAELLHELLSEQDASDINTVRIVVKSSTNGH